MNEFLEVQLIDQQSKLYGRQFKSPPSSIKKTVKQTRKTLTIEEITAALLMPKLNITGNSEPSLVEETQLPSSNIASANQPPEVSQFHKAVKL